MAAAPVEAIVRPTSLKRALRNVVENAVRYGGRADLRVVVEPASAIVTIDDAGPAFRRPNLRG